MTKICEFFKKNRALFVFLLGYLLLRILFINVNYTEWGDTFRMIRGAEHLSNFSWPWDEKRWPFYSLLLVPGIWMNAPVFWGRILSIFASLGTLIFIYKFYYQYVSKNKIYSLLSVIITSTSSVFAYWSLRVMADLVFAFLVILFFFYFIKMYKRMVEEAKQKSLILMSLLLLAITMTRLEGLFVATGVGIFLFIQRKWRDIVYFMIPQALIYIPFTVYAKFIYSGQVQNDYLSEAKTFVFDLNRLLYFFTYTAFILVIPLLLPFLIKGGTKAFRKVFKQQVFLSLFIFIFLEILIGFIWTPSLPRIYMPIISFIVMYTMYGVEKWKIKDRKYYLYGAFSILLFLILQYNFKLYFLGASKVLFGLILLASSLLLVVSLVIKLNKKFFIAVLIALNLLISIVVINNQRLMYKTVKQGINYLSNKPGLVAYSDETGNTEWYLRSRSLYLDSLKTFCSCKQYDTLKKSGVTYLLWTNEFNRGKSFIDPKNDSRYELLVEYTEEIDDPLESLASSLGLSIKDKPTVFDTKIYKVE